MESIIGALNALILNRLVTRENTGQGKNIPTSIIVDELPTLYFHKIDRLIGTARSNKVCVTLGFQELPQLEADYGKVGMQKIITTVGNVVSSSARSKEILEWLSSDIFGKVVQLKKGVTIDRDKTSINLNENMDSLLPASKISDTPTGWICGQTARDFVKTKIGRGGSMNIQESEEFKTSKFYCKTDFNMADIKKEEDGYVALPKFYTFKSRDERERILYKNFVQVGEDVKSMINTKIPSQMKIKIMTIALLLCLCPMVRAQTATPTQSDLGIFHLPLFERAIRCIKFYEGWHDIKRNYPYIGWGHCVQPHENFKKNLTLEQADSLLRSDLRTFCGMFRKYGKDSLLLAVIMWGRIKCLETEESPVKADCCRR